MAGLAEVGAGDMVGRFTGRLAAVVATDTGALNFSMVYPNHWRPTARSMAGLAEVGAGNMVTRFTGRLTAVMAADTVAGDTTVVEGRAGEAIGVVAVIAGI